MEALVNYLSGLAPDKIFLYLDASIPACREHYTQLGEQFQAVNLRTEINIEKAADTAILKHQGVVLSTSDSEILDHSSNPVFDLPGNLIRDVYKTTLLNLRDFLE